jgi:hypothetical protein
MAYKLPRHPYLVLVFGPVVIAVCVWLNVWEFETGKAYFRGGYFRQADNPIGFAVSFTVTVAATLVLAIIWCVLAVRIWRARRERSSLSKRPD